jgi:hypothetical protein
MTYPTIFERLRAMQPEESLSALIGEACDVGDGLVEALKACADSLEAELQARYPVEAEGHSPYPTMKRRFDRDMDEVRAARAILAKARRCPDGECTEKCANGGAA